MIKLEMKRIIFFLLLYLSLFFSCGKEGPNFYTIGMFQVDDAPTLNEVRRGFLQALEEEGLINGLNVHLIEKNARGDIPLVQKIAQEFVSQKVNLVAAFSTPCLQAAIHVTRKIPIVFASVANPYLAGAEDSAGNKLTNVTGVSSLGPVKEGLVFLKKILPSTKRIGTLWTPSEINSEFYLSLARNAGDELGIEVVDVPVANKREILMAAQILINKKIDVIYQISDNTINASFQTLGHVAEENGIPLFGGFLLSIHLGACAATGWDFFDMGYKAGKLALRIKKGENPANIPIQYMSKVELHLNLNAAKKQGVVFPEEILRIADEILAQEEEQLEISKR